MKIKERIFSKYTLYVLCFVILNVFDAVRDMHFVSLQINNGYIRLEDVFPGYKMGDIWVIIANATGIFMMLIVLSGYRLRNFLTKVNFVWTGLCIVAMIVLPFVRTGKYGTILVQEELAIINAWWILLVAKEIIAKAIREKKKVIKFNLVACLWIALTICMVFSIAQSRIWPIFYMGMFGCFYLTEYKKEDVIKLFDAMIDGSIFAFLLMQTVACLLRPYDTPRYEMLYSDCNMAASYYLIIYVMFLSKLHLLHQKRSGVLGKIACVLGQGSTLVLMFMTGCRMVCGTAVVVTIVYGIVVVKILWKKKWLNVFVRGIILMCVTVMLLFPIHWLVRWIPTILPARLWYSEEMEPTQVIYEIYVGESKDSAKYVELEELVLPILKRFINTFTMNSGSANIQILHKNVTTAMSYNGIVNVVTAQEVGSAFRDASLNERLAIYKAYYDGLTWWGNRHTEQMAVEMRYHAHCLYLQIAYFYGIPAGVLLIVIGGVLLIDGYKNIVKYRSNPYLIIPFLIGISFFCSGLMNVVWNPGQLMLFMLFFTQFPFEKNEN